MEQRKKNLRCTRAQIQLLQKYMVNNKTIAYPADTKAIGTLEASRRIKEWFALRVLLRKYGPDKSVEKWKQTWRDLKKKLKKQKLEAANSIKVGSLTKKEIVNNSDAIHETSMEYADPLESIGEGGASIKAEPSMSPIELELPSIDINLDNPCSSPMQVVLTNTEDFISNSTSTSTQTLCKPTSGCTHHSNPPCISRKLPSVCSCNSNPPSICSFTSNPPSICVHGNSSTPAIHNYAQSCRQNVPLDAVSGTSNLHNQNALLQRLCNLLEEQNSNLRIRNRIERNKMRYETFKFQVYELLYDKQILFR